jgi:hypothetical protein
VFVASLMQHTKISRLERCCITMACGKEEVSGEGCCIIGWRDFWRDVASQWHAEGSKEEVSERVLLHQRCNALGFRGWRDVASVACGRKRLASECLLHQRCNALGLRGWRDVASVACGKEEVSGEGLLHR